jgi:SAM-dependent methyltransferase
MSHGWLRRLRARWFKLAAVPRWTAKADGLIRAAAKRLLPEQAERRLVPAYRRLSAWPPVGQVRFGGLRRLSPISSAFGSDRGQPIDRYYIEQFLEGEVGAEGYAPGTVRGRVLEIGGAEYAERFGDAPGIEKIDVLDPSRDNPDATVIADLTDAPGVPSDAFDCVICTQTLLLIYDVDSAVRTLHRILCPGGTLLVTVPGISQICRPEVDVWGDYWRFTALSLRRLLEGHFRPEDVSIETYGNVLTSSAFLYGLTVGDLTEQELEAHDPNYQLLIGARAVKAGTVPTTSG